MHKNINFILGKVLTGKHKILHNMKCKMRNSESEAVYPSDICTTVTEHINQ